MARRDANFGAVNPLQVACARRGGRLAVAKLNKRRAGRCIYAAWADQVDNRTALAEKGAYVGGSCLARQPSNDDGRKLAVTRKCSSNGRSGRLACRRGLFGFRGDHGLCRRLVIARLFRWRF